MQSSIEEELFITATKWLTGADYVKTQNCFGVRLGYYGEIPIPSYSLQIDIRPNLIPFEYKNAYKCYFVFVGGKKYVENMKTIVDIVGDITEQFYGIKPIAMFVLGKLSSFETYNFSSHGQDLTKVKFLIF